MGTGCFHRDRYRSPASSLSETENRSKKRAFGQIDMRSIAQGRGSRKARETESFSRGETIYLEVTRS